MGKFLSWRGGGGETTQQEGHQVGFWFELIRLPAHAAPQRREVLPPSLPPEPCPPCPQRVTQSPASHANLCPPPPLFFFFLLQHSANTMHHCHPPPRRGILLGASEDPRASTGSPLLPLSSATGAVILRRVETLVANLPGEDAVDRDGGPSQPHPSSSGEEVRPCAVMKPSEYSSQVVLKHSK